MTRVRIKEPDELPIYVFKNSACLSDSQGMVLDEDSVCITLGRRRNPLQQYVVGSREGERRVYTVEPPSEIFTDEKSFPVSSVDGILRPVLTPGLVDDVADMVDGTHGFFESVVSAENLGYQLAREAQKHAERNHPETVMIGGIMLTAEEMYEVIQTVGDKSQRLLQCRTNLNLTDLVSVRDSIRDMADNVREEGPPDSDIPALR